MRRFVPPVPCRTALVRLVSGLALATAFAASTIQAQIPGRNVNMVSGVTLPDGDPYLQRQNEPSVAASTRNPLHLLGGSNDYRTVDIPGVCVEAGPGGSCLEYAAETGDAWLGLYKSADGGQRWTSTLLPGYPQEPAGEGLDAQGRKSPLFTGGYKAAADPVVRAGTNGLLYYAGLSFDRGENGKSAIFLARFVDNNNREERDATAYLGTGLVATASGTDGRFLDKPWMAVDIPRGGNPGTCRIETPGELNVSPTSIVPQEPPVVQIVPAGTVYVAYTSFFGPSEDRRSEIFLTRSFDCGVSWQAPMRVSRAEDPINQGVSIAIDPRNGHVYVAWRRFSKPGTTTPPLDGIMFAKLPAGGRKFNPPGVARRFPKGQKKGLQPERFSASRAGKQIDQLNEFDQATGEFKFRTNAYPAMAVDGDGRAYLAWSERGFATFRSSQVDGDARIVMATTTDGNTFTAPRPIDNSPAPAEPTVTELVGHQVMPSVAFAGGKIMVAYYDLRETKAKIFGPQITDANLQVRNTIDIRAAMAEPGEAPEFDPSVKVSEYMTGFRNATSPREQLQFNPPNLPMFKQGTVPFMGDYIDLAPAPAFVPTGKGRWAFNTAATAALPTFHAVWTDNRDVRAPADGDWTKYGPPTSAVSAQACVPGKAGSRNQNIYTSRIAGGLLVGSPGNAKPLSATVQRGFVVFAQNATTQTRTFRMTILNQPPGGRASFDQFPRSVAPALRTSIDLRVLPRSTASRTVYITSTDPRAQVKVDTSEIADVGGAQVAGGLEGLVVLNPDIENPDIENPDIENPDIENPDIENVEVYNPDIENPDIENPEIKNPDIENPDIENPDIENPDIENITVANPDIENPDIENPDIENPDIENPDIENPDIENVAIGGDGVLTDITWNVTNTGNTTSAFNVNLFLANTTLPEGLKTQLILHKTYRTPAVNPTNCLLAYESRTIVVANIPRPEFVRPADNGVPDQNDPSEKNATLWLSPGEVGKVTLRVYDALRSDNDIIYKEDGTSVSVDPAFNPQTTVTPTISSQGVGTLDKDAGRTDPPLVTPTGANLFFLQMPTDSIEGAAIAPAVSVQVRDNLSGLLVPGAPVTLSLATNPTSAILSGGNAVSDAFGIATFPLLSVSLPGTGYTLIASATTGGVMATALSAPFNVVPSVTPSSVEVNGTVRYAGNRMQGVTIKLVQGAPTNPPRATTVTNADGIYSFAGVAPGAYWVRADGPDASFVPWGASSINVAAANVTWNVQMAKVIALLTPANSTTGVSSQPTLTWTANAEAASYTIQINKTLGWVPVDPGATSATNQYTVVTPLDAGTQYTWQVDAYDGNNRHVGSTVNPFTFTVGAVAAASVTISNYAAVFDGSPKPVTVVTNPPGLAVSVTYNGSPTVPSAIGAYLVQATVVQPGYVGAASVIKTIASTLSAGGAGGSAYGPLSCAPGVFANGVSPSTNGAYGLYGGQLLCSTGTNPSAFIGQLSGITYASTTLTCGSGEVMVGLHGMTGAAFFDPNFQVVANMGPRCQSTVGGTIIDVPTVAGGYYADQAFTLTCNPGEAVTGVVGGVGEVVDSIALVCAPPPPPVTVAGPVGGTTGGTTFGPFFCPAGTAATGFRVATNDNGANAAFGSISYALTAASLLCSDGGSTLQFGGTTTPNTDLVCGTGELLVGMFGSADSVLRSVGPRCQSPSGGAITQPAGDRPGSGTSFGPIDCPAGTVVLGVQGRQGAVLDQLALVCGPAPSF